MANLPFGMSEVTRAAHDVLAEREKQRVRWGDKHDSEHHHDQSLTRAAATYCLCAEGPPPPGTPSEIHLSRRWDFNILRAIWPTQWVFNPKDRRSNLVRAGALILAEIERLDRAAGKAGVPAVEPADPFTVSAALRRLIADDAYAMTFQTFGQYRTALLKAIDNATAAAGVGGKTNG